MRDSGVVLFPVELDRATGPGLGVEAIQEEPAVLEDVPPTSIREFDNEISVFASTRLSSPDATTASTEVL